MTGEPLFAGAPVVMRIHASGSAELIVHGRVELWSSNDYLVRKAFEERVKRWHACEDWWQQQMRDLAESRGLP